MCKPVFAMISKTKYPDKCKTVNTTRIKRYTSYYIHQNCTKPLLDFVANAKAPIEHLLNDHSWCDSSWCWSKKIEDNKQNIVSALLDSDVSYTQYKGHKLYDIVSHLMLTLLSYNHKRSHYLGKYQLHNLDPNYQCWYLH